MSKRKKIAVFATEPVTGKIGGLGIRQLEVARTLSRHFDVRLFTSYEIGPHKENFPIERVFYEQPHTLIEPVRWADVVYSVQLNVAPYTKKYNKPLVIDLLVHEYFEDLEYLPLEKLSAKEKSSYFSNSVARLTRLLTQGDFFLCPTERGRDYYLGLLTLFGRLHPNDYHDDPQYRSVIDVAPFGIPRREPKKGKNIFRNVIPGIGPKDFLIVWGGSLSNWFDCQTPIRAMARLKNKFPKAKLVFTGNKHPVQGQLPRYYQETIDLAREKGVLDKNVFFNNDWVPYDQRDYYLTEADAGIVTFYDHIENRFSFRIRGVDYLWANLPTLTNPGNSQSDLIERKGLGRIVPYGDDKALANEIEWMATHKSACKKIRENIAKEKKQFHWEKALAPLINFCKNPKTATSLFADNDVPGKQRAVTTTTFSPDQILKLVPSHPYMQVHRAKQLVQEGQPEEAAKLVQNYMKMFGSGLESTLFLKPLFGLAGDIDFEDLVRIMPAHPQAGLMKAKIKMDAGEFEEAAHLIDEEISLFGVSEEAIFVRGLLYQLKGEHKKAVADFKIIKKTFPNRVAFYLPLAESLVQLNEETCARKLYTETWKKTGPHGEEAWIRARVAIAMAKLESSKRPEGETLKRYLNKDPQNEPLAYAIASALENEDRLTDARKLFENLTVNGKKSPLLGSAWFRLARLSPKDQQKQMLENCLSLYPTHRSAREMLESL